MTKPVLPLDLVPNVAPATILVRGGATRSPYDETCEALFLTSGFVYDDAAGGRSGVRPGGLALRLFALPQPDSGDVRGALAAARRRRSMPCHRKRHGGGVRRPPLPVARRQKVVSSRALFGSCHYIVADLLPRWGIETVLVDGRDLGAWEAALAGGAALAFCESPSNPAMEIIDLAEVARLTHCAGGLLVVDNVFATPLLQRPLRLGADVVVYSATKHIDGQGRCLGGAILASEKFIKDDLGLFYRHTGPSLSPFNAWLLLKGLETLELRVDRQCRTALAVANYLETHPKITRVLYPGLPSHPQYELARRQMTQGGGLVCFDIAGDKESCFRFHGCAAARRHLEQSGRLRRASSPIRRRRPIRVSSPRRAPNSASATRWCASRPVSKPKRTCSTTSSRHSPPFEWKPKWMKSTVFSWRSSSRMRPSRSPRWRSASACRRPLVGSASKSSRQGE